MTEERNDGEDSKSGRRKVFALLRASGVPFLINRTIQRRCVTIILYHDIPRNLFNTHIKALKGRYSLISLKDFLAAKDGRAQLPIRPLIITIDDGYKGNYDLRGVVKEHSVPITLFVSSQFVDTNRSMWWHYPKTKREIEELKRMPDDRRTQVLKANYGFSEEAEGSERQALSGAEILSMKKDIDIQSHGRFHPGLVNCTDEKADLEISASKKELETAYGLDIYAFSYPIGAYSERELRMVKAAGYACAVTVEQGYNTLDSDMFRLKRICITDDAGVSELMVKTSGLWRIVRAVGQRVGIAFDD